MQMPTGENLRSLATLYYVVSHKLSELAIQQVPAKEIVAHMFNIAWISGIAAYQGREISRDELMQIERDAYVHAVQTAEEEL
jgi:hypothetical protein